MKKKIKYEEKFKANTVVEISQIKNILAHANIKMVTMEKRGVYDIDGKELEAMQITVYFDS